MDQKQLNTNNVTELDQNAGDEKVGAVGLGTQGVGTHPDAPGNTRRRNFATTILKRLLVSIMFISVMTRTKKPTGKIRRYADVCRPHTDLDWHLPHLGCSDINFSLAKNKYYKVALGVSSQLSSWQGSDIISVLASVFKGGSSGLVKC